MRHYFKVGKKDNYHKKQQQKPVVFVSDMYSDLKITGFCIVLRILMIDYTLNTEAAVLSSSANWANE